MIFATVGNHPQGFLRLLKRMDELAKNRIISEVFLQVGYSDYQPKYCSCSQFVGVSEFEDSIEKSDIIITHGGAGSILTSLSHKKPTIVVPRLKKFGEHNNDHQLQLTRALEEEGKIIAVYDIEDLEDAINKARTFKPKTLNGDSKIIELIEGYLTESGLIRERSCLDIDTREHWDSYHEQWKDRIEVPANPRTVRAILANLDVRNKKILEVGSGSGRDGIYLAKLGADCYLVDYVETSLKIAREIAEKEKVKVTGIKGNAKKLPFPDGYFDLVYSQGLIEHFTEPETLIREQIRVLKKDGYLLTDVPQKYHFYTLIKHFLMFFNKWTPGWETEYSIGELERLIKNCGLQIVFTYGDWSHPPLFLKMVMMMLKIPRKSPDIALSQNSQGLTNIFKKTRVAHYTFQHIGVVGKK